MTRATDCIYCGDPAGSAEHTILAALGGLRTDRGILCGSCNNGFGATIDAALARDMNPINAVIGVVNGRTREPISTLIDDAATGRTFVLSSGSKLEHPEAVVISDAMRDGVRSLYAVASTQKQADDFVRRLKEEGKPIKVTREKVPHLFASTPTVNWTFGGPDGFRAIARLVLNLVASFRPSIARGKGLIAFKDFIRSGGPHERWIRYAYAEPISVAWQFDFSHRFILMFDAARGEVRAHVSLLDIIELSVSLGAADVEKTETITYEIDVLAKSPPNDIAVTQSDGLAFPEPIEATSDPRVFVPERLARVLIKREARLWAEDAPELVIALNAVRDLEGMDRHEAIVAVLRGQTQRLLNVASFVAREMRQHLTEKFGADAGRWVGDAFGLLVQPEAASRTGVTEVTRVHAEMLPYVMADHLLEILNERPIESDELRFLLEGKPGAAIIGRYMMEQVEPALPK